MQGTRKCGDTTLLVPSLLSSTPLPFPIHTIPYSVKKNISLFLLLLSAIIGCTPHNSNTGPNDFDQPDSLSLHVAVMPTSDCLPLYLAQACGITDSLGLDIRLHTYMAQMDVDTAIQAGHVSVAYSDLIRALRLEKYVPVKAIMQGRTRTSLVTLKGKRVKKIHQMKERMVAISRLSLTDYWCDAMLDSAFMLQEDVYRPQIHDIRLRTEMVRTQLIDAAMLPEPYTQWMQEEGNHVVFTSPREGPHFPAWIVRSDSTLNAYRKAQIQLMVKAYESAARQMTEPQHRPLLVKILKQEFQLPPEVADTLHLEPMEYTTACPDGADVQRAADFLRDRAQLPENIHPDSLIWKAFITKD